jgi:diguanylate cyclase (GGDEF)-like protein
MFRSPKTSSGLRAILSCGLLLWCLTALGQSAPAPAPSGGDAIAPRANVQASLPAPSEARESGDFDPMVLFLPIGAILLGLAYWQTWQARKRQQQLEIAMADQDQEIQRLEKRLENAGHFDSLTGLPNRKLLRAHLQQLLRDGHQPDQGLAMLRIRIGGLKKINDTLGYAIGDGTLHAVGDLLAAVARDSDVACHLGGNEFAMLITSARDNRSVDVVCARLIARLAEPMMVGGHAVQLDANVGIVPCAQSTTNPDEVFTAADDALSLARNTGINTWRWGVAESFTFTA